MVENMSTFVCPHCGNETHIFGHGGARETAGTIECDFLGEVPLHLSIRETSDAGAPISATQPDSPQAKAFLAIASKIAAKLKAGTQRPAPTITFE
jgi:ATP-binding protein involved in chromosome partitioning